MSNEKRANQTMKIPVLPPDERFYPILKQYARGHLSAYDAACEIQELGIPGYEDPSASEVILWAKRSGYGLPTPTEEEAREEAAAILSKLRGSRQDAKPSEPPDDL